MKYRIETQKPNIYKKKLRSYLLNRDFKLWISMKTRKCIMKAGSLDKYLLNSKEKHIDSKFGIYLRYIFREKQVNPEMTYQYIPGTAKLPRNRRTKIWEHRNMPTMYTPANLRAVTYFSEFYEKPPHEMSRYELNELEKIIRIEDGIDQEEEELTPSVDAEGNVVDKLEEFKKTDYYF